jgi:hypothetical protein
MRTAGFILLLLAACLLASGCACQCADQQDQQQKQAAIEQLAPPPIAQAGTEDSVASTLVFDPPLLIGEPPVALAREDRQAGAFVGYQEQTITSFYIRIDDRQTGDHDRDRYERRAIIEQVGATYR